MEFYMNKLKAHVRLIRVQLRSNDPLKVGKSLTKIFLLIVAALALLPEHTEEGWSIRLWRFMISPSNEIGDTFAGIAGALAFLWIIVTVMLQSRELKEQRRQLEQQTKEFEAMNSMLEYQSFESALFEMVSTHNQLVQSIDLVSTDGKITQGRDCFAVFYRRLKSKYDRYKGNAWSEEEKIANAYELFWERDQANLSHYFRFLFNAFRIVSEFPQARQKHGRLLRSLISDQELLLLFYNCLTPRGSRFKVFAVEFDIFDNLPVEMLLDKSHERFLERLRPHGSIQGLQEGQS